MILPALLSLAVLAHFHWVIGIVGFALWIPWKLRSGQMSIPEGWQYWCLAFVALIVSTLLANRPSGLAWGGLVQWVAFGLGIVALQDVLRERRDLLAPLHWVILGSGLADGVFWLAKIFEEHHAWWNIRVEGLPTFPFRVRLFGSHGSTQSAVWLGFLLLLAAQWAWPRLRSKTQRALGLSVIVLWCLLLGFSDSRLGAGAFAIGCGLLAWQTGWTLALPLLTLVPGTVWLARDLAHPSRVATGGGVDQGWLLLACQILLVLAGLFASRRFAISALAKRSRRFAWALLLSLPFFPLALIAFQSAAFENWTSGRLAMWKVGFDVLMENPIFGVGPWGYVWEYAKTHEWGHAFLAMHPHNVALELLMAGGIVLLLPVAAIVWRAGDLTASGDDSDATTVVLGVFLVLGMLFDSPMSSPQVRLALTVILATRLRTLNIVFRWNSPPRTLMLLPLLSLVPVAIVLERQVDKNWLSKAEGILRAGHLYSGAVLIRNAGIGAFPDPQVLRNNLMARTTLEAEHRESLMVFLPLWDSLCEIEPGFLPNRVHRAWVDLSITKDSTTRISLLREIDRLWIADQPEPPLGEIIPRWKHRYPSDDIAYWLGRLDMARSKSDRAEVRWIRTWLEHRIVKGGMVGAKVGLNRDGYRIRANREEYLYGSSGTGWLLIPQLESMLK